MTRLLHIDRKYAKNCTVVNEIGMRIIAVYWLWSCFFCVCECFDSYFVARFLLMSGSFSIGIFLCTQTFVSVYICPRSMNENSWWSFFFFFFFFASWRRRFHIELFKSSFHLNWLVHQVFETPINRRTRFGQKSRVPYRDRDHIQN